jgi:hypothetical protein
MKGDASSMSIFGPRMIAPDVLRGAAPVVGGTRSIRSADLPAAHRCVMTSSRYARSCGVEWRRAHRPSTQERHNANSVDGDVRRERCDELKTMTTLLRNEKWEWPRPMRMPRAENTQHEVPARLTGHAVTREVLLGNSFQEQNKGT